MLPGIVNLPEWKDLPLGLLGCNVHMPDTTMVDYLAEGMMEAYDSPLERDLQQACHLGDLPAVKRLMSQGANVFACNMKDFTFLMISASQGHFSVAKELLTATAGADVGAVNKQQHTALILVTSSNTQP
ncbi:TPA: Ankyrin repeat and SAM domain-containing protein 3 [Trebouxia sp. C0006]